MILSAIKAFFGDYIAAIEVAVAVGALCFVGFLYADNLGLKAKLARADAAYSAKVADAERERAATIERYRLTEQRRAAAMKEIADETERLATRARAAADGARSAGDRLLARAAIVAAQCGATPGNPAAPELSASGVAPGLLAGVLRSAVDEARRYAAIADEARRAGGACERAYDTLTLPAGRTLD